MSKHQILQSGNEMKPTVCVPPSRGDPHAGLLRTLPHPSHTKGRDPMVILQLEPLDQPEKDRVRPRERLAD